MGAKVISFSGDILTMKVFGKLSESELREVQTSTAMRIQQHGAVRVLVMTEGFQGWENDGNWEDFSFQSENDQYIAKMAMVGEKKWEELSLLFTAKGLRPFPIEYFALDEEALARAWLEG